MAGRPSKLTLEKIEMAIELRKKGFSLEDIARFLGINKSTLSMSKNWVKLRDELNEIKRIQEMEDVIKIKKSLVKLAQTNKVKKKVIYKDAQGNVQSIVETVEEKQANQKAIEYFLNNKCPEEFKANPTETKIDNSEDGTLKVQIVGGEE